MEPLRGTAGSLMFSPVWPVIVVRSVPHVPGFRGISSLAALAPVFHDPALRHSRSLSILFARQAKKLLVGKGRVMCKSVVVYTLPECQSCRMTKMKLDQAGISYTVVDLNQDDAALERIKTLGHLQAPVVEADSTSWSGFRPDLITALTK